MDLLNPHEPVHGFSLVELAIVIAIVMSLLTLGLGVMNAQVSSAASSTTKQRQAAIRDALIAYLGAHKRLPCPYVPTPGTAVTGQAPAPSGTPACPAFGIVPFATLGLGREVSEDGWGNFFSYKIYFEASPTCPGIGKDWGNDACFGEGKTGNITINDSTVSPPKMTNDAVVVVISHGSNGLGAWLAQGTRNVSPTKCEEAHNAAGTTPPSGCTIVSNTFYKGEREENDDVVAYLTASEMLQMLAKQGTIKSAVAQVQDDLQDLYNLALGYKAQRRTTISGANPGDPDTSDCSLSVSDTPTFLLNPSGNQIRDPWGNLYVVGEGAPPSKFPICVCSGGSVAISSSTCPVPSPPPTITCKRIEKASFDSYLVKAGMPTCP